MNHTATSRPNRGRAAGPENRRALIAAAREIYATEGPSAPFSAIAKRAGVGQGSLYRHFPDRISLAVAVFEDNVAEMDTQLSGPDASVADLMRLVADHAMSSTALIGLVTSDLEDPRVQPLNTRFRAVVERLVENDHEAGRIGGHIDVDDVSMALGMIANELSHMPDAERPRIATRAQALFAAAFAPR